MRQELLWCCERTLPESNLGESKFSRAVLKFWPTMVTAHHAERERAQRPPSSPTEARTLSLSRPLTWNQTTFNSSKVCGSELMPFTASVTFTCIISLLKPERKPPNTTFFFPSVSLINRYVKFTVCKMTLSQISFFRRKEDPNPATPPTWFPPITLSHS